jgi:hypothetical protein
MTQSRPPLSNTEDIPARILKPASEHGVLFKLLKNVCIGRPEGLAQTGDAELEDQEGGEDGEVREPPREETAEVVDEAVEDVVGERGFGGVGVAEEDVPEAPEGDGDGEGEEGEDGFVVLFDETGEVVLVLRTKEVMRRERGLTEASC